MRFIPLLLLCGCGTAAAAHRAPENAGLAREIREAEPRDSVEWRIRIDTKGRTLGAYTLTLRYTANVAVIREIRAGDEKRFKGSPEYDPATFRTGTTRVTALDAFPSRPPAGAYELLTVTFRRVAAGRFTASAEIEKLYDDADKPLSGQLLSPRLEEEFR